jgi:adenylate cyclase
VARTEFDLAQGFDDNLLRLVRRRNDPVGQVLGNHSAGRTLFFRGRFASSRSHQEEALALYDPIYQRSLVDQTGFDPRVGVLNYLALALFCLGFPDQALARSDAAVAEARKLAHPHSFL